MTLRSSLCMHECIYLAGRSSCCRDRLEHCETSACAFEEVYSWQDERITADKSFRLCLIFQRILDGCHRKIRDIRCVALQTRSSWMTLCMAVGAPKAPW